MTKLLLMAQENNTSKNRKTESQKIVEEADSAGRFSGDDADARAAKRQAMENIRQDTGSSREERDKQQDNDYTDADARREGAQAHDVKGEAQNVNDDTGRPLNEEELNKARNKASEGDRQGRSDR
jgi:hypothetical protein